VAVAAALGAGTAAGALTFGGGTTTHVRETVVAAQPTAAVAASLTPAQIYALDAAGVVEITVTTTMNGPFAGERSTESVGSGFVIDKSGHIVTSAHVVDGASSVTVTFKDGTSASAAIVGSDASTDIAVLRVDVASSKLKPLALGDSSDVAVGDEVVAIGSPFGYEQSITAGIVSAVGRSIEATNGATISKVIQTDAAINPGSSGGPLIDSSGQVIGVNAQIESSSNGNAGVGFAVPSSTVKTVVARILAGAL
jgi:putative serine protease PepD